MENLLSHPLVIQSLVFLAVACLIWVFASGYWKDDDRTRERLKQLGRHAETEEQRRFETQWQKFVRALNTPSLPNLAERLLPNDSKARTQLQSEMIQAGIYSPTALTIFTVTKLGCMILPLLVGLIAVALGNVTFSRGLLMGAIGGMIGLFLPVLWLEHAKSSRKQGLRRSLPDFLDLVVACLESGMSIQAALVQVTEELRSAHPDLANEMGIVQGEAELGRNIEEAFFRLAERTAIDELRSLATFIQQAQKYGATMADAMRELSEMLRLQREQRAEEQAQKAAVKILVPTVLFIFPAIFVVLAAPAAIKIRDSFAKQGGLSGETRAK